MANQSIKSKAIKIIIPIVVGIIIAFLPTPHGLSDHAWVYLAIFIGLVIGLILEPIPSAFIGLIAVTVAVLFRVGPVGSGEHLAKAGPALHWGLSGFSNAVVWLIFAAFMIGIGFSKSGLGRRIALALVSKLGKRTLGLGYAVAIADGILAPFIPSNAARSGGTSYPIVTSIAQMYESTPDHNPRKIGSYLSYTALAVTCVSSSIFLTGQAPNPLALELAAKAGVSVPDWLGWFLAMLPVSIILFLITPLLVYWFYPPTLKGSPEITKWAKDELEKSGKMHKEEWFMIIISIVALVLWIGGGFFGVNSTTTALIVIIAMVSLKVISWQDFLGNKPAWNVLTWFATLVTMAGGLKNVGFIEWLATKFELLLHGFPPLMAVIGLILLFSFLRYFFASGTAFATAAVAIFVVLAQSIPGTNPSETMLLMILPMGFVGILTPYGTGHSPIWFASGYIKTGAFWGLGLLFTVIYLIIYLVVGMPWISFIFPHLGMK
ncbi:anion permease [Helicobacter sp. 13S00401-1]|uniref:DASS family sodium-coupled anion symporter n=1 Tax=Helicobacter sp. 13S00401-1 TaxID=1905758 RepID=UPI000BA62FE8|nr:DASS family sodium-coupled anion symporter [Helicobacter sp. 13S00401-1]PAF51403.1 anion permease [Helicobacter sp. 13S00401-1]